MLDIFKFLSSKFYLLTIAFLCNFLSVHCQSNIGFQINNTIINPHDFKYVLNPGFGVCGQPGANSSKFYLVYVHTAPLNFVRRMAQRETWMRRSMFPNLRYVFMMGISVDPDVQEWLQMEQALYNDIVQEDFLDSYRNLSRKGVMAMRWVSNFCSHAEFVMKVDDDIVVNLFHITRHMHALNNVTRTKKQKTMSVSFR
jgi:beta-1,3-galactosyltransferase 1